MTGERSYAVLPYPDLDEALDFYRALGFTVTFHQRRPYPAAVVARDDLHIHLSGIDRFVPENSYASVIITVPDPGELHAAFAAGLRDARGRVPLKGIPRLLPVRRKAGTATGFSVVDVGGNWLRFYRSPETGAAASDTRSEESEPARSGLARVIDVAARQGDARGDERQAIVVLDAGLQRHPDAPAAERFAALAYRAELTMRLGEDNTADITAATALVPEFASHDEAATLLATLEEISS